MNKRDIQNELWWVARRWLLLCGNKIDADFCKEEILNHPDYPSLISLVDFVESGKIGISVIKSDINNVKKINYPAIAHINKPGDNSLIIVNDPSEWGKNNELIENWSGVVIYPVGEMIWYNDQYQEYLKNIKAKRIIFSFLLFTGTLFWILFLFSKLGALYNIFALFSLLGIIISCFLFGTELGYKNEMVVRVCASLGGGCEGVIKDSTTWRVGGISIAAFSLIYFSTQFVCILVEYIWQLVGGTIFLISLASIIIAFWSVYTQAKILKKWCILCLAIVATLVTQFIISLFAINDGSGFGFLIFPSRTFFLLGLFIFLLVFVTLFIFLKSFQQIVLINKNNKADSIELRKWKRDASLFMRQWESEPKINTEIAEDVLSILYNPSVPIIITAVCNPYCLPCANAHKELDRIISLYHDKVGLQIRFICPFENRADSHTRVVESILRKASELKDFDSKKRMLSDWFEWMDLKKWESIWLPNTSINVDKQLIGHNSLAEMARIQFTPTFYLNGRRIPLRYSLRDIELIIPEIAEIIK